MEELRIVVVEEKTNKTVERILDASGKGIKKLNKGFKKCKKKIKKLF